MFISTSFHQVYHHGTLPVDYLYLVADTYLTTGRLIHSIVDRTLLLVLTNIFSPKIPWPRFQAWAALPT